MCFCWLVLKPAYLVTRGHIDLLRVASAACPVR
ncbi:MULTISPECIES: putative leader peptide [Frankiaceae]